MVYIGTTNFTQKNRFKPVWNGTMDRKRPVLGGSVRFPQYLGWSWTGCGPRLPVFGAKNRTEPDLRTLAAKHELLSPELDNDAGTSSFTIWSITLESFAYVDGVLQSTGTCIETNALIGEEPVAIGHCKQVQMVLPSIYS